MGNSDIVRRIEVRLSELGKTKSEFYRETGITSASLSQWNSGQYNPSRKKLQSAADYLGVSYDYLKNGEGERRPATIDVVDDDLKEYLDVLRARPEMRMLFSTTKTATKTQIEAIVQFLEGLQQS